MILTSLSINISRLTVIAHFDFYKYNWHLFQLFFQQYPSFYHNYIQSSVEPGVAILYKDKNALIFVVGMNYWQYQEHTRHDYIVITKNLVFPVGFEKKINSFLKMRFGDTFTITKTYLYWQGLLFKNNINFGFDLILNNRLSFSFATNNPLNYKASFFGLHLLL